MDVFQSNEEQSRKLNSRLETLFTDYSAVSRYKNYLRDNPILKAIEISDKIDESESRLRMVDKKSELNA